MPTAPNKNQSVLQEIAAHKQLEIAERKRQFPLETWMAQVQPCPPERLETAIREKTTFTQFILEIKPSSPSAGVLAAQLDPTAIVNAYNQYGIAISVLTDQRYFGGSLELLSSVASQTHLPVLCKDFILDPYQVYEARKAGASIVLLIVKMLDDAMLSQLFTLIKELGMTPLVEIQNEEELTRALKLQPSVLLINNRDLDTLAMDLTTTARLSEKIPPPILRISASGIESRADIERIQPACDGFLVGSTLMRHPLESLNQKLAELTGKEPA